MAAEQVAASEAQGLSAQGKQSVLKKRQERGEPPTHKPNLSKLVEKWLRKMNMKLATPL